MDTGLPGREAELAVLTSQLDRAAAGAPRVALCVGEPGIGKTRLAEELVLLARDRGWLAVWGRAVETQGAPPYWPWRQVLRAVSGTVAMSSLAAELGVAGELAVLAPELFPAGVADASVQGPDSPERRFRMFDAVARYLHAVADRRRLLLVLDDMHWADPASLLLLLHVARDLGAAPLLVLVTYRDTEPQLAPGLADLVREPAAARLVLPPLDADAVGQQLAALTGRAQPMATVARVHELTGGNPFFVGELARNLDAGPVPATVRGAIRQRMDRMSPRCRHHLRAAAVLGREFPVAVAAAVVGQPVLTSLDLWDEAVAAGLLVRAGEGEHRFTHALVRDAIEADLPVAERARLHAAAAEAIEAYYAGRLGPHLADLARHWAAAAGATDHPADHAIHRVIEWSRRAGDEAMSRLSFEDGVRLYRQALHAGAAGDHIDDLTRYHLLISLTRGLAHSADLDEALRTCGRAAALARRLSRPDLLAEAALALDPTAVLRLDVRLHELRVEAVQALGPQVTPLRARLLAGLSMTSLYVGEPEHATETSEHALAVATASGDPAALISALRARHLVRSGADGVDEREELASRLLTLCDGRRDDPQARVSAYSWRVDVRFARGDLAGVAADLENLDWWVRRTGGPTARWHLLRYRAALAQARGAFAEARQLADEAFAAIAALGHPAGFPVRMALLVSVDHHCGADPQAPYVRACLDAGPGGPATPGHAFRIMDYLGPAMVLQEAGYSDEASAKLRALGPVPTWRVPPFHQLIMYAFGTLVAIRAGADDVVADLRALMRPFRGRHVVSGIGVEHYCGPVELYLGVACAHLGDGDAAVEELSAAVRACESAGAVAHVVEARCELATVLARRGDTAGARSIAGRAIRDADALGMAPWRTRLAQLTRLTDRPAGAGGSLTAREYEVAVAVARGLSNRQIAAELHLSERTAQNHVQHILTKLGFANRAQIAVWVADRGGSTTQT